MKSKLILCLILAQTIYVAPVNATSVIGATEITQYANYKLLFDQYQKQIEQYKTQIKQWDSQLIQDAAAVIPLSPLPGLDDIVKTISGVMRTGEAMGYELASMEKKFIDRYPDYGATLKMNGGDFVKTYANWGKTTRESLMASLRAGGLQAAKFQDEDDFIQALKDESRVREGRNDILRLANDIQINMNQDLKKLRVTMIGQNQAHNAYMLGETKRKDAEMEQQQQNSENGKALLEKFWADYPNSKNKR